MEGRRGREMKRRKEIKGKEMIREGRKEGKRNGRQERLAQVKLGSGS